MFTAICVERESALSAHMYGTFSHCVVVLNASRGQRPLISVLRREWAFRGQTKHLMWGLLALLFLL